MTAASKVPFRAEKLRQPLEPANSLLSHVVLPCGDRSHIV
jgi:hypothetical protein